MKARRLVILGGNSHIGGRLADHARRQGSEVLAFGRKECDLLDRDATARLFGSLGPGKYALVILAVVNKAVENSYDSFLRNVQMVKNIADGQKRAPASSIVFSSSVDVYGNAPATPITERTPVHPDTWYGAAKCVCEWLLSGLGGPDCPVTVLRLPGIYGRSSRDRSVIGRMAAGITADRRVTVTGTGKTLRDYVYVEDLSRLMLALVALRRHGVLNAATGTSRSIMEYARLIGRTLGAEFEVVHGPPDPSRDFDLVFDTTALSRLLPDFRFSDPAAGIRSYAP